MRRVNVVLALGMLVLSSLPTGSARAAAGDPDPAFGAGGVVLTGGFAGGGVPLARAVAVQSDRRIVAAGQGGSGFALVRYLQDGTLDSSFGSGGRVVTEFPEGASAYAIVIQPDGRIVAAGYASIRGRLVVALARYLEDGSPDTSFGQAGVQTTRIGSEAGANALVLLPDGRIVAVGTARGAAFYRFALVGYLANGHLDRNFGNGGRVLMQALRGDATGLAAVLQADGRIVVGGAVSLRHGPASSAALVRYLASGRLDVSFGKRGVLVPDLGDGADADDAVRALAIRADGRIVAAGSAWGGASHVDFALFRVLADGRLDASFGVGGIVRSDIRGASEDAINAIVLQADGKIVAVGQSDDALGGRQVVARYTMDGVLDGSFGQGGFVLPAPQGTVDRPYAVALGDDGGIVVAGETTIGTGDPQRLFLVERFLP